MSSKSTSEKLTKKQKKALAFRQRKNAPKDLETNAIPEMEEQDLADAEIDQVEAESMEKTEVKASRPEEKVAKAPERKNLEPTPEEKSRKRKREEDNEETTEKSQAKQRFILFIGNLKYTTTKEAIAAHFAKCDPPPSIRLLTPKFTGSKPVAKSKGCAFLEFSHRNALQQALKLHHSELEGRMINVELTAGGGGKGESRMEKLKQRNKGLFGERSQRSKKVSEDDAALLQHPQRFSSTSGIEQPVLKKRTWTVGDDGETHRGGKRKTRGKKTKNWGTGVNLIPVG